MASEYLEWKNAIQFVNMLDRYQPYTMEPKAYGFDGGLLKKVPGVSHMTWRITRAYFKGKVLDADKIRVIAKQHQLRILNCPDCKFDLSSVSHLGSLANLSVVDVSGTNLDDDAFEVFTHLSALREIDISNTEISNNVVSRAKARNSELVIHCR